MLIKQCTGPFSVVTAQKIHDSEGRFFDNEKLCLSSSVLVASHYFEQQGYCKRFCLLRDTGIGTLRRQGTCCYSLSRTN